jgi:hypothetical protein
MSNIETAEIIQFAAIRPKLAKGQRPKIGGFPPPMARDEEGLTDTCKNQRLRQTRYDDWRKADAMREYWRAFLKMNGAIERVQHHGLPEGDRHPQHEPKSHYALIHTYRAAIVAQLLTPAPTAREITWKRAVLDRAAFNILGRAGHGPTRPAR